MNNKNVSLLKLMDKLWFRILTALLISLLLVIPASKPNITKEVEKHASLKEFTYYLDECLPKLMEQYDIPGVSIALVKKGNISWLKSYGYADLEEGRKMTTDTYCRLQSISKSVTAWGVMKLVQQGQIELDKPVKQYLTSWEFPKSEFSVENITVRKLLSHNSGMPAGSIGSRYFPEENIPTLRESLTKEAILKQDPGQSFFYSNTGFNLLELLIEEVTGSSFAEYMEKEVFIPLGMNNSSFAWSKELKPEVPIGYDLNNNPVQLFVYPEKASGGLFSSVEDIATFVAAGMKDYNENTVLNTQSINKLYTPMVEIPGLYGCAFDSYGLGHFIEKLPNGMKAISHGGQGCGCMTHFYSVPKTGDGIVILTNSQRTWPFISYILTDWAQWNGFSSVGMSKIIEWKNLIWCFIGLMLFILLLHLLKLLQGLIYGKLKFAPLYKKSRFLRLAQGILSIVLISILLWCINQEYLFISSLVPIASKWLGFIVLIHALVLLLLALFPSIDDKIKADVN